MFLLYQSSSAFVVYVARLNTIDNSPLSLDHLTGLCAICGTLVELATLVLLLQPCKWKDNDIYFEDKRQAMPDVDTSTLGYKKDFPRLQDTGFFGSHCLHGAIM
jgi:hypothetical protein